MERIIQSLKADKVAAKALTTQAERVIMARMPPHLFIPMEQIDMETQVFQSSVLVIGQPGYQARYIPVATKDAMPMNAMHDYVLRISNNELPSALAFWSLTLYDLKDGFFIPYPQKK